MPMNARFDADVNELYRNNRKQWKKINKTWH